MSWAALIPAIVAALLAIVKGIWGDDKPIETNVSEATGSPIGPKLAARLQLLGSTANNRSND